MKTIQYKMDSKIGPIYLIASKKGLRNVSLKKHAMPVITTLKGAGFEFKILSQAVKELELYFAGKLKKFTLPLDVQGTPFQKQVWQTLQKIPYGKTVSYKDIASKIKNEKAVRAVGLANGRNSFCIVIPCHRVIAADGTLGGYSGGLHVKTKLLEIERTFVA